MRINRNAESDPCPVTDDLLGKLYRSSKEALPALLATLSPNVRAALASYCYRRAHLQGIGLAAAATCSEQDLVVWGGTAGAVLFARSHQGGSAPATTAFTRRQNITLASGVLRKQLPFDQEQD
jgi:hypothetical protein